MMHDEHTFEQCSSTVLICHAFFIARSVLSGREHISGGIISAAGCTKKAISIPFFQGIDEKKEIQALCMFLYAGIS